MPDEQIVAEEQEVQSRPAPTGVDLLHSIIARISGLEARMAEVERCKHDNHNIEEGALKQISGYVKQDIAQGLAAVRGIVPGNTEAKSE